MNRDIPILGVKAGTYDIQRFIYWYFLKCFWDESDNLERSIGVNFDWYYPKFAYRHTPTEVKNGLEIIKSKLHLLMKLKVELALLERKNSSYNFPKV
uniref:SAM-dependent methyltransferase n=1 Tax=uncultured marine thaumarchaeote AD1000_31_G03 TaxID=1455907 RepID=A0A075FTZ8_9ARCH|nr:SAM-dependent methyltransferase [uncultured marine thaumarchaeote AD1000_31_G03]